MNAREATKKRWVLPLTAVCLVLGALLALQFRSGGETRLPGRADVLAPMLAAVQERANAQAEEIADLRAKVQLLQEEATKRDTALKEQLEAGRIAMGLSEVKGPGIVMTLEDSTLCDGVGPDADLFLVHDSDLWPVVNELRSAGAEAISVNGERVIGTTAIRCVGPVLQVNAVPVTAPFEIKVIGDPKTLAGALSIPNGVIDRFKELQFPVRLDRKDEVVIPAISVSPKFRYAKSVVKSED